MRIAWILILFLDGSSAEDGKRSLLRTPRIIGGDEATKNDYPWMVYVSDDPNENHCGGSLVAPNVVLSAAHCLGVNLVHIGRHDPTDEAEFFETIEIEEEVLHPFYDRNTLEYDYMLLKLKNSSTFTDVTISLDNGTISSDLETGNVLRVIGWGATRNDDDDGSSTVLKELDLEYITNAECQSQYADFGDNAVTERMICVQDPDQTEAACSGDSGGPLFLQTDTGPVQVGIMSWSGDLCAKDGPDVFARVSNQIDWINAHIEAWTNGEPTPEVDFEALFELLDDQIFNFTFDDFFNFTDDDLFNFTFDDDLFDFTGDDDFFNFTDDETGDEAGDETGDEGDDEKELNIDDGV